MNKMRTWIIIGVLLMSMVISGCATTKDLKKVEQNVLALRAEFETSRKRQQQIRDEMGQLRDELGKLNTILGNFRKQGRYNFANIGVKITEMRELHQRLLGRFQVLKDDFEKEQVRNQKLFKAFAGRFGDPTAPPSARGAPKLSMNSPKTAYSSAKALFDAGKYRESRDHLKLFIKKFPQDPLTESAYMLLGDCYNKMNNQFEAILLYNDIRKKFPDGKKVDLALLKLGLAHYKIQACPAGKAFFRQLLKKYRDSPHAEKAREYLRNANSMCKKPTG